MPSYRLIEPPLFTRMRDATVVLIAGAGGGFDVYGGLPLAVALEGLGKQVHLANLSFGDLDRISLDDWLAPGVAAVHPESEGYDDYFPERSLARWLASTGRAPVVYTFPRSGVRPLRAAYRSLIDHLGVDALVLIDGGTDILLRGDEAGLGTPHEDMTSLAAVAGVDGWKISPPCNGRTRFWARSRCRGTAWRARHILRRYGIRSPRPRCAPASCTRRSRPRCAASSGTYTLPTGPRAPNCS
ncbi:DUF1152 domain-containing protein [Nocardia brasiliensis]|uniref:DUF1152 domain-containing protein n=1 Tax=Nocardia brasiliensis TaxID=37326 RepID=UPI000A8BA574|nr:DUF1152 domain-containing protein [Nocardia brasiliensis]